MEEDCWSGSCYWSTSDYGNGWCTNLMDQCWNNMSLQNDLSACDANAYCNSTSWGGCEPSCFSATTSDSCNGVSGCKWNSGWCNPVGMNNMFDNMESGSPVPLGVDIEGDASPASVDIIGFGMKDMGDSYGIGAFVSNFENSSVCNKEKISSHVFNIGGGSGGESYSDKMGNGNETVKYIIYLDTDGSTSGNCAPDDDNSSKGHEFKLRYASEWNASLSKAAETFTSYKCDNNAWKVSDIKISAWKKIMCNDIGGPLIAIEKGELSRFPTLYDSTKDMRVYVATMGLIENATSPSDVAGPGWTTPGTVDFAISSTFSFGANVAKFEDILKKGFVQGEDCFTAADDDNDGSTNCDDWDCQYSSACTNLGVNAAGYIDTSTPQVTGVKIEEYPDAALIMYDTNKPSNGTLQFYYNDSSCLILNKTIYDIGITSNNIGDHKLWHTAEIYNDRGIDSLNYSLVNDTNYYYKLKICDNSGKCAISRCSSFQTSSQGKCGFCDFVTRIKTPTGWTVLYDTDRDGTYDDHTQGQMCGPSAGLKSNYTMGRNVNIKMANSDNSTWFEFINASLTKTGLNDKVRTISTAGDLIGSNNLVGLTSETRDKIINNLHPEICRIKITSSSCTTLYHCDDSGDNCVDRTAAAGGAPIDTVNCVWNVPNCEFSTYRTVVSSGSVDSGGDSSSSGGGGGGGGGGATKNKTSNESSTGSERGNGEGEGTQNDKEQDKRGIGAIAALPWRTVGLVAGIIVIALLVVAGLIYGLKVRRKGKVRLGLR